MVVAKILSFTIQRYYGIFSVFAESFPRVMHDRFVIVWDTKAVDFVCAILSEREIQI